MSRSEREAAAAQLDSLMRDAASAWGAPDAAAQLTAIASRAARQPAQDLYPQVGRVRTTIDELNTSLAAARAALEK
ncbi:MAG: hypothetical protein IPJ41_07200 [Phycisphaerales bacterium]|nr:hypothetical protein [Phycisphaerales bacterium]